MAGTIWRLRCLRRPGLTTSEEEYHARWAVLKSYLISADKPEFVFKNFLHRLDESRMGEYFCIEKNFPGVSATHCHGRVRS